MRHRHLTDDVGRSLSAIDDVIARGNWNDWVELRRDCLAQPHLLTAISRICAAYADDPGAQRQIFWMECARRQQHTNA